MDGWRRLPRIIIRPTLALVCVLLCCSKYVAAQEAPQPAPLPDVSQTPAVLSGLRLLATDAQSGSALSFSDVDDWCLFTETGTQSVGIPRWRLGVRRTHDVSSRLQVGVAASASRGSYGPSFWSRELGTDRDLSVPTPLTSRYTYKTTWDTTFSVAAALKRKGRVRVNAVGEIWNPFVPASTGDPVLLPSRALRFGIVVTY